MFVYLCILTIFNATTTSRDDITPHAAQHNKRMLNITVAAHETKKKCKWHKNKTKYSISSDSRHEKFVVDRHPINGLKGCYTYLKKLCLSLGSFR